MKCAICDSPAVISRRENGISLCREHFIQSFESKIERTILSASMIYEKEKIAVALSGGKDSTALLFCLHRILSGRDVELLAVTVDEGIAGYRDDTIQAARTIAERLGVEQYIVSFQQEYSQSLDEMVVGKHVAPCTYCGVFRKHALNRAAKSLGADKIATGHNLDDEAQTVMMNYLKGDMERLMRLRPRRAQRGLVPRIKPLRAVAEKEIALYCMLNDVFFLSRECPYANLSLRAEVRDMMNILESRFPGTKLSTVHGFERLAEAEQGRWPQIDLAACRQCGEPCVGERCKACELLDETKREGILGE
ncbi:MAG: TIGR00269 family protein [Methanothrix sp.]